MIKKKYGFNIVGYITHASGLGEIARAEIKRFKRLGYPISLKNIGEYDLRSNEIDEYKNLINKMKLDSWPYEINLFCHAGDFFYDSFWDNDPPLENKINIAIVFWELQYFPKKMKEWLSKMDLILAPSLFIKETIEKNLPDNKVIHYPNIIETPKKPEVNRERFSIKKDAFVFVSAFDALSDFYRKNPFAVIKAFQKAFPKKIKKVSLVIKIKNADLLGYYGHDHDIKSMALLKKIISKDDRIQLVTKDISKKELFSFYASCDAYISLHRAEGLGLIGMEMMSLGIPTVQTAWSGNMDIATKDNCGLVEYDLTKKLKLLHPAYKVLDNHSKLFWAEANIDSAAEIMKKLFTSPEYYQKLSVGGKKAIVERNKSSNQNIFSHIEPLYKKIILLHRKNNFELNNTHNMNIPRDIKYFVSYAQNMEDAVLHRALKGINKGLYIDIGAQSPDLDSVTKSFFDKGWRGINVEPNPFFYRQLNEKRKNDINLPCAIGSKKSIKTFYIIENTGLSTLKKNIALQHKKNGFKVKTKKVNVSTLNQIWESYIPERHDVHFLKIDAEGFELEIIKGNNWLKNRPWIILVESMEPNKQIECHEPWEKYLLKNKYKMVYMDGLNRFYLAKERGSLLSAFKYPLNIFDNIIKYKELNLQDINSNLQLEIKLIKQSRSWKITSPLRFINRKISDLKEFFSTDL
jgi:FkbM family methyltransferase